MIRCFQWVAVLEVVQNKAAIKYPVYHGKSEHDLQHEVNLLKDDVWKASKIGYTKTRRKVSEMYRSTNKLPSIRT